MYIEGDSPIMIGRAYGRVSRTLLREELVRRCVKHAFLYLNGHKVFAAKISVLVKHIVAIRVAMQWDDKPADSEYCRCAEAGVGYLDSRVDRISEVNEGLSSVLCTSGRTVKSRYRLG